MTRQEKLKKAKELKQQREVTHFLDASESLVKLLSNGVDVNLDDLVSQLGSIEELKDIVDDLNKTIATFKLPEDVKVAGLESIVSAVKNITIPESKVSVDFADSKSIKQLTDLLEKLVTATSNKVYIANTLPEDFVPVRRVRKVGNRLIFDDDTHTGSSGGGGGGRATPYQDSNEIPAFVTVEADGSLPTTIKNTDYATSEKQDEIITAIENIPTNSEAAYSLIQFDDTSDPSNYEYYAKMADDGYWFVKRLNVSTNLFEYTVPANTTYSTGWANRASLTYVSKGSAF